MELQDLQHLIVIAEAGSLVRAAERPGVTQPTLSKSGVPHRHTGYMSKAALLLIERLEAVAQQTRSESA